jgi:hypothetical protein
MVLTFKTEFNTIQNLSSVDHDRRVIFRVFASINTFNWYMLAKDLTASAAAEQAWDKPVWNPVSKKELKWPNISIPPLTGSTLPYWHLDCRS